MSAVNSDEGKSCGLGGCQTANKKSDIAGGSFRGVPSSRFISYRAQMNAYNEALTREIRNMPRFTGEDSMGNLVVRMPAEGVGEGYEPNPSEPTEPRFMPKMNAFEMKFDFETLQPYALYPVESV
ncbi:hypothetical protein [Pseudomonas sp. IT-347P]|uniref:hypothetical protein n=1 Tax=Pseudomonas sp. IT-347P TaxID=3026458 RepID=UPI0039DFE9B1